MLSQEKIVASKTEVDDQFSFLLDVALLVNNIAERGYSASGGHLWRSLEEQERLVKAGLSWTMDSRHMHRMAIDLNLFKYEDDKYILLNTKQDFVMFGYFWEGLSEYNWWGVKDGNGITYKDFGHFERRLKKRKV